MPVNTPARVLPSLVLYQRPDGEAAKLTGKEPLPLIAVGNRCLVEHQLDWLSDQGFKKVILNMDDRPRAIQSMVRSGARWGTQVIYVESPADRPLPLNERLRKNLAKAEHGILLVDGDSVLDFEIPETLKKSTSFVSTNGQLLPVVFCTDSDLRRILAECKAPDMGGLCAWVAEKLEPVRVEVKAFFHHINGIDAFLEMNRVILAQPDNFSFRGSLVKGGIRRGRRISISEKSTIHEPALIGDQVFIRGNAHIGPNALIGDRCFIDRGAHIMNSVVAPDTYIGRNTSFEGQYVCRNYVVNLADKTTIFIDDPIILADLTRGNDWTRFPRRLLSGVLFLLSIVPMLFLMPLHRLLKGNWVHREKILKQPVQRNLKNDFDYFWHTWHRFEFGIFFLDVLPSFFDIMRGHLNFVGNPPLGEGDFQDMENLMRGDQLRSKAGCTGLVQQLDWESVTPEEVFATIIYYNATRSRKGDALLFLRAFIPGVHRYKRD